MTPEHVDAFRTWMYPFGFVSSVAFGLRFVIQWWYSEREGRSVVPKAFWILSCVGNALLAIHSLIQLHFPIYLMQSQQLLLAWRNLNLMGSRPLPLRKFIFWLCGSAFAAVLLFASQCLVLPEASFGWLRAPRVSHASGDVSLWVHSIGILGVAAFSARFWLQWWDAETKRRSVLSEPFWWISLVGTAIAGLYFFLLSDWVNLLGPLCAFVPYSRNLILLRRERTPPCDVVIIAGETSGDLLGEAIARQLVLRHPSIAIGGVAGPAMRKAGVRLWLRSEAFHVMGIVDVIKKIPFLLFAVRTLVRRILDAHPAVVLCIDQPSMSIAIAKRLKRRGYQGKIVQVVAPTVWAYRPERADTVARYFDLILPLFRFEVDYFRDKLEAIWVGHPAASLSRHVHAADEKKATLALFPGSRPGEIRRNLPLQLQAAAMILGQHPEMSVAIATSDTLQPMVARAAQGFGIPCQCVDFADRYLLMERSKAAIAKSGTITLELALFNVPTVCCYQTGRFTQWWAKTVLKLTPRFFALPNILTGQQVVPECILPPVRASDLVHALEPYLKGDRTISPDVQRQLRFQIDASAEVGVLVVQAVERLADGRLR